MRVLLVGWYFFWGSDGYEVVCCGIVWYWCVLDCYFEVIVQVVSVDDIVSVICYVMVNGYKVSVVFGGYSFVVSYLCDGVVLFDVSWIDYVFIDVDKGCVVVGLGKGGSVFMVELEVQGLFFLGGYCRGVCFGGYLLQGGYGWNSWIYGLVCESVIGLDVIIVDGVQIYCDVDNYVDLYWVVCGVGLGFFGVVILFYLKLYLRLVICGISVYVYLFDFVDEVFIWVCVVSVEVDFWVEL